MIIYNFVKYIANRLIIWRSQVQALAGPQLVIKELRLRNSFFHAIAWNSREIPEEKLKC